MRRRIVKLCIDTIHMFLFIIRMLLKEDLKDYIKKEGANSMCSSKKLVLLGNGPSLIDVLKNWKNNEIFKNADCLAVNYFCFDETFKEIQPKYYVLSDPHFFDDNSLLKDKADKMYVLLNESVTWKMFLYIQYYAKDNNWSLKITNNNINIIPFHSILYTGYKSLRNWFFSHGLGSGNYGTVIQNGEFIGLNLGYKTLYLYGVDHNFFSHLCINENNQLCNIITHFYDNRPLLKPICHYYISGKETMLTMSEYLREITELFHGHEILRDYADYCSAKIYNCTQNSLIDAYERL